MKAIRLLGYGGQLVFNDIPMPTIAPDQVQVKMSSTAVNHLDLVEASGMARQILPISDEEHTSWRNMNTVQTLFEDRKTATLN